MIENEGEEKYRRELEKILVFFHGGIVWTKVESARMKNSFVIMIENLVCRNLFSFPY